MFHVKQQMPPLQAWPQMGCASRAVGAPCSPSLEKAKADLFGSWQGIMRRFATIAMQHGCQTLQFSLVLQPLYLSD